VGEGDYPPSAPPSAGWYVDPNGNGGLRWWDGIGWTDDYADGPTVEDATPPPRKDRAGDQQMRIMDRAEAKKKWRTRQIALAVLGVLAVAAAIYGGVGSYKDQSVALTGTVTSEHCSKGVCTVRADWTEPNGQQWYTDFDKVSSRSIRNGPDGQRVMTLYWFPHTAEIGDVAVFRADIIGTAVVIGILGLIALGIRFVGRDIRRQAKSTQIPPPAPGSDRAL
jgi:hypothetical protein